MIKLKEILLESKPSTIFVPRRIEDRTERLISLYIRNGNKGDLDLSGLKLTELPEMFKDITVGGNFYCSHNKLTSLINAPNIVVGNFGCSYNDLTSLEGAPKTVGGDFYCGFNNLTSLEGAPKSVGENFICRFNPVRFTEEQVRAVCNVKGLVTIG